MSEFILLCIWLTMLAYWLLNSRAYSKWRQNREQRRVIRKAERDKKREIKQARRDLAAAIRDGKV